MVEKLNLSEAYNEKFLSIILPLFDITSLITIILTSILIVVIITQSPKQMKNFKIFLLLYVSFNLILGICLALYCPIILQPYLIFYPVGLIRILPPNFSILLLGLILTISLAIMDSCAAMSMERFFAMKNLSSSMIPTLIYRFLLLTDFVSLIFIFVAILNPSLKNRFLLSETEMQIFMEENFSNYGIIDFRYLIVFVNPKRNTYSSYLFPLAIFAGLHLTVPFLVLSKNIHLHFSKKHTFKQLKKLEKHNNMLLRMTSIQFFGMSILLGLTVLFMTAFVLFYPNPTNIVSFAMAVMNFFCFYDTIITILFIDPYRKFFVSIFKKLFYFTNRD